MHKVRARAREAGAPHSRCVRMVLESDLAQTDCTKQPGNRGEQDATSIGPGAEELRVAERDHALRITPTMKAPEVVAISLDAAEVMAGISRRTLWRRVTDGALAIGAKDGRGRATVLLDDVRALIEDNIGLALGGAEAQWLVQADAGDAAAQADIGALLYVESAGGGQAALEAALYWLRQAADKGNADAMHWLGTACAAEGSEQGNREAMMWIAKAAAHGHVIAQKQLAAMIDAVVPPAEGAAAAFQRPPQ